MTRQLRSSAVHRMAVLGVVVAVVAVGGSIVWKWSASHSSSGWGQIVVHANAGGLSPVGTMTAAGPTAKAPGDASPAAPIPRLDGVPRFTTALARDPDGSLWVGSEDDGLVRYDPRTNTGRAFKTRDGLGDDSVYALAVDHQGRVWAGHLNHGVSVYDHNAAGHWQNYEVVGGLSRVDSLSGPIGERVFDIAVCPTDGDVWVATNCGLSRYSEMKRAWSYVTRLDGLPSDDVAAIAFDSTGRLYVATNGHGLAFADAGSDYKVWQSVHGPAEPPTTIDGEGLPSDLLNDVLVTYDGTVFVATTNGLAFSSDRGQSWRFIRGQDWADKVRQRRGGSPAGWKATGRAVLSDDYCTTLADDAARHMLWVGHPGGPVETLDLRAGVTAGATSVPGGHYARAILIPPPGGLPIVTVAGYGDGDGGLWRTPAIGKIDTLRTVAMSTLQPPASDPPLPAAATSLSADALSALATRVAAAAGTLEPVAPNVAMLDDDWRTQGAWLGRYGKYWACLSAMDTNDYLWGATPKPLAYARELGPDHPNNYVQFWRTALYTDNPKSLEMPRTLMDAYVKQGRTTWATDRRQADWNDAGEQYPKTYDGPDLYISVDVPTGEYTLSLYDYNKDGHASSSDYRGRDMTVSIFSRPAGSPLGFVESGAVATEKPVVRRRLRDFWGGMYQRFYVRGPAVVTVRCHRVFSANLMLSAVLLDTLEERPAPFAASGNVAASTNTAGLPPLYAPGRTLFDAECERFYLAGSARPTDRSPLPKLETCHWSLWQFGAWERAQEARGQRSIRGIENSLRWDGMRQITKGCGLELLSEYLQSESAKTSAPNDPSWVVKLRDINAEAAYGGAAILRSVKEER